MLQTRDVTNVVADYCVYGVRYATHRRYIEWLFAFVPNGRKQEFTREAVINAIECGTTFCTGVENAAGSYTWGAMLKVIKVGGIKYLKTVADGTPDDNLGNLPEM